MNNEAAVAVYEPRGKTKLAIDAMRAEPQRAWPKQDLAMVMDVHQSQVQAYMAAPLRRQLAFSRPGNCYAFTPLKDHEPDVRRAPAPVSPGENHRLRTPGDSWKPPQMQCPRPNAGALVAQPEGKREQFLQRIRDQISEDMVNPIERGDRLLIEKLRIAMPHWDGLATPTPAVEAAEPALPLIAEPVQLREEPGEAVEDEAVVDFDFAHWRDGSLTVWGAQENEDGSFTISATQLAEIKRRIAWSPMP